MSYPVHICTTNKGEKVYWDINPITLLSEIAEGLYLKILDMLGCCEPTVQSIPNDPKDTVE